ncbi:MAG: Npt1/Npt2 family nucleotide transporter, partial [Vicinamibacterales bacterium]
MLRRLLQIRRGESTRAVLLFAYLFLVITSFVVTKTTRDALFLGRYGAEALPYADIAAALSVGAVMALYLRVSSRVGLRSLLLGTLVVCSATSVGFWVLSSLGEPRWMLPVLYVWASVCGVLLPAQVWTLANHVVTTREAKRLFGIVAGGAVSGWIVGGLVTRATAMSVGTENLLLVAAAALAICPALVVAIWRDRRIDPAEILDGHEEPRGLAESLGLVWQSAPLRAIAMLIGLSSLVTTVVAWQFRAMAHSYIPGTDELAAFFGLFNIYAGALSLVAQFFLASRLLRRFGLGVALLVVPVALTFGSLGVLVSGTLLTAVLLKGSDQVLRYSVDRSSVELLYLPIPARQMANAKALIDTVVWRIGDGAGALVVLVGVVLFGLNASNASQISAVTLLLLVGWIGAALAAKHQYVQNLRNSIYEHRVDAERLSAQVSDRSTTDVLADALGADNPDDILYALALLERRDTPVSHEAVRRLLDHRLPEIRKKAIALLAAADDGTVLPRVEQLLRDDDLGVRAEALLYLARLSNMDPLLRLAELDGMSGSSVISAIAQFLARPGPTQKLGAVRILLDTSLADEGPDGHQSRLEAARVIGSLPDCFEEQLTALLNDLAPDVVRLAIRSAASLEKVSAVPLVLPRLADPELSADAADALVALGDGAVPALRTALDAGATRPALRYAIPDVLQRMATPSAEEVLVEHLLDPDPLLRLRAVAALNKLRQLNPDRRLERELVETVLAAEILGHYRSYQLLGRISVEAVTNEPALQGLKESMSREIERIFRLMKLLLPEHDLHSAYVGLQSGKAVVHSNALEFLEQALPPQLRNLLLPLIDSEVSLGERIKMAERMVGATLETSEQALAAFAA